MGGGCAGTCECEEAGPEEPPGRVQAGVHVCFDNLRLAAAGKT